MFRFVTLEGGDGSGKSTQMRLLDAHLGSHHVARLITREPGDTSIGQDVRRLLLERRDKPLSSEAELFLIAADRAQHVREIIRPALAAGQLVLCDRYTDSTLAYQGYGRGIDLPLLRSLNHLATQGLMPDLTLVFDCPAEVALGRATARLNSVVGEVGREDRFEAEGLEFQKRVREGFLELAKADPARFVVLNGNESPAAIHEEVRRIIDDRLRS